MNLIKTNIIKEGNKEYHANIEFTKDEIMSPNGIDKTWSGKINGDRVLEVCTKLDDGKYKLELYK